MRCDVKIISKTGLEREQIVDKVIKGSDSFEIHLTNENMASLYKNIGKYLAFINEFNMKIEAIHSPICCGYDIEDLTTNYKRIEDVFFLADEMGKFQNKVIPVIMHMDYNLRAFEKFGKEKEIVKRLNTLLNIYSHSNASIENLVAFGNNNKRLCVKTNCDASAPEFAEYFNKKTGKSIGTVLDTCHMLMSIEHLKKYKDDFPYESIYSIEDYIRKFIKTLNIVHLSNMRGNGIGYKYHATPFETDSEISLLEEIIKLLYNYGYNGIITLELSEEDYANTKNWLIVRDNLYKAARKLKIKI
jgi:sugar phosphate isomerase/epimerase